ncbi:hypothetical protein EVAR_100729_1 [Eumeta japonica]|uniref:Uncharacterized protein n=1 Tax=Eumeta variegata TaxID=151549 RepID=A0A4C2A9Z3_EUMVA|nr:hypothetical protein EVAR_100729_1 [Eumeta japonica]
MLPYEELLMTLDKSKPEHEELQAKMDSDILRFFELASSIKLAFDYLGFGKESKYTAGPGSNSASFVDAVSRLPTLSLTQFSGRDQNWLSFMNTSDSLVNS